MSGPCTHRAPRLLADLDSDHVLEILASSLFLGTLRARWQSGISTLSCH